METFLYEVLLAIRDEDITIGSAAAKWALAWSAFALPSDPYLRLDREELGVKE
jgi:hypothetical protein